MTISIQINILDQLPKNGPAYEPLTLINSDKCEYCFAFLQDDKRISIIAISHAELDSVFSAQFCGKKCYKNWFLEKYGDY